ncbi:MAG: hypothetical protein NVS2B12_05130 [Ktedonobacteraceae bacterium]
MFSPDEVTQNTDALEQIPRTFDRRSALIERRQNILQQKQTDVLPPLSVETPNAKLAWRQVTLLREENRHLRFELDSQRVEVQRLMREYETLKGEFESEVAVIHNGHQQEVAQYQVHLQESMYEYNRLHDAHVGLEQRYQELSASFQQAVEEEARKHIPADGHETSPILEPALVAPQVEQVSQDAIKEWERQAKEEGDKYLAEAVFLKREARRMINALEQERQQLATQRQEAYAWQHNMSQHVASRQKTLHDRLYARWRVASLLSALGLVVLLLVLQLLCLVLLHVSMTGPVAFALIAPIVVCVLCAFVLSKPVTMLNHIVKSVPHVKKGKKR